MFMVPAIILAFVLGSIIGSFCNVLAWRIPNGLKVNEPKRSFCPKCQHQLAWYDNIPILGWILLGGKCRYCHAPISLRYPFMELLYAIEFAVITWAGFSGVVPLLTVPALLFVTAALSTMAVIDYDTHYVYDSMVNWTAGVTFVLLALTSLVSGDWWALVHAVIGSLSIFGVYLFFFLYFKFIRHIDGVGVGDLGVAIVIGLPLGYLGLYQTVVGFFSIFIIAAVVILLMLVVSAVTGRRNGLTYHADANGDAIEDKADDASDDEESDGGKLATAHVPFMLAGMLTGMLLGNGFVWLFLSAFGLASFF